jgi:hypothetical protein
MKLSTNKSRLILYGVLRPPLPFISQTCTTFLHFILYLFLLLVFSTLTLAQPLTGSDKIQNFQDRLKNYYQHSIHPKSQNTVSNLDSTFTVLGRWAWGPCVGVDVKGSYAYIGNGPTFDVLDVSNPSSPKIVGEYLTDGFVQDIIVRDWLAYVNLGGTLLILDVTNPLHPTKVGSVEIWGATHLAIEDSLAFVTIWSGYIQVIDISNPTSPYLRGWTDAGGEEPFLATKGKYAYTGSVEGPGVFVVDATNPDSLNERLFADVIGTSSTCVRDTLLIIGHHIFSIAQPDSPSYLGMLDVQVSVPTLSIAALDSVVYLTTRDSGVFVIDITNPINTQARCRLQFPLMNVIGQQSVVLGHNLYISFGSGVMILDVSNEDSIKEEYFFPTGGGAERIAIRRNLAYVVSGNSGVWIIDFSDVNKPKNIGNVNTLGYASNIQVSDNFAYVANFVYDNNDTSAGLWIVDISDSTSPKIVSHYKGISHSASIPNALAKSGNLILMTQQPSAGSTNVLEIIDVTNPQHPQRVGVWSSNYEPYNVAVRDSFAYIATVNGGLRILDIHTPSNPTEISSAPGVDFAVQLQDSFAYVASAFFSVINIANPYLPSVVSSVKTHYGSSYVDLAVDGNWAYWAEGVLGIVDISDPKNPLPAGSFQGYEYVSGVAVKNNIILFSDNTQGVWVLRNNRITVPQSYSLADGWNLVSVPSIVNDSTAHALFPSAISHPFIFNSGYGIKDTLRNGYSYWLKFDSSQTVHVSGIPLYTDTVAVAEGWNMIGSISVPVAAAAITTIPPGLVTGNFFGYSGTYSIADSILPGKGYWVRSSENGYLILAPHSSSSATNKIKIVPTSELPPMPPVSEKNPTITLPKEYGLDQAYPNPFNPTTTIKYQLPAASKVTLKVYNLLGQVVDVLEDGIQNAGYEQVEWNASSLASGIYFYRLETTSVANPIKSFTQTRKMILLK